MEVIWDNGSILIIPETDFERSVMQKMGCSLECFHKHGASEGDYVGIKVRPIYEKKETP